MNEIQLVLVGAGHAHLHLAGNAETFLARNIRPLLIDPGKFWYSGMATGMLGGMYTADQDTVDPGRLITRHGGDFLRDRVKSINPSHKSVSLASGKVIPYDVLSLNIGSKVNLGPLSEFRDILWTVKPIRNLWQLRQYLLERDSGGSENKPFTITVVGGGSTGCESAANLQALTVRYNLPARVHLISREDRLLPNKPEGAADKLRRRLSERGITITLSCAISYIDDRCIRSADNREFSSDITVAATGLRARTLIRQNNADTGIRVRSTLQSLENDTIFAAGDCASLEGYQLPKLGVFGVRQAPILLQNIQRFFAGSPLLEYVPQKRYLSILNLGDGTALAIRGRLYWMGTMSQLLKNYLDNRFLRRYQSRSR
ncbi:MAG TPA: FAD-dependent oxidoreductase [bacterium]|nr:FAD-dependent oxidoreductase [bacterium]